jgi:MFS family permease
MEFSFNRNLIALIFIKIAKWLNLVMPIIVLFYTANGLSMQEIFILQSVYSFTIMALEIPTGYLADLIGRKKSILAGCILGFAGYLTYSLSSGFWEFAVAETILGLGISLVSGADSALLYDSLVAVQKEDKYTRFEGKITSYGNYAEALAGLLGGLLAVYSLRTPYYVQTIVAFSGIPAALFLVEPALHTKRIRLKLKAVPNLVMHVLFRDVKLKWNILLSAFTGACTLSMAWLAQPYLMDIKLPTAWFGGVWAILNLTVGIAAMIAWRMETRYGEAKTMILFSATLIASYFLLGLQPGLAGILIIVVFYFARGIATPTLRNYIQQVSGSENRATIMSVRNFIIRLAFAIIGPVFGFLLDNQGLRAAFLFGGIFFGITILFSLYKVIRLKTFRAY